MTQNNEFGGLAEDIKPLLDEKKSGTSLARKARTTLETLGIQIDDEFAGGGVSVK
jgi:hypothetical protein